jgi:hypothetical protein
MNHNKNASVEIRENNIETPTLLDILMHENPVVFADNFISEVEFCLIVKLSI